MKRPGIICNSWLHVKFGRDYVIPILVSGLSIKIIAKIRLIEVVNKDCQWENIQKLVDITDRLAWLTASKNFGIYYEHIVTQSKVIR